MALPDPSAHTLSLATFRRNGAEVRTPVWYIMEDGKVWVVSLLDNWKIKRLRNDHRVRFAPCDPSGRKILGDWSEGTATLNEDAKTLQWLAAREKAKYTWRYFLIVSVIYRLLGRGGPTIAIEIAPHP